MSEDIQKVMNKLNYDELKAIERDLSMGVPLLKDVVSDKIKEHEACGKTCAVCGANLLNLGDVFNLVFGPKGFKKKASFCAVDCLGYFIEKLKDIRQKKKVKLKSIIKT